MDLTNTCPACGAEESLDALLMRMIEDDDVRRLIAEVLTQSLPVGGLVVRYLRLHKPEKQRLRMSRVAALLAELVPDIQRGAIHRRGRDWAAPLEAWRTAMAVVFEQADRRALNLPLDGNAYLYEVLMRQADTHERQQEAARERDRQTRRPSGVASPAPLSMVGAIERMDQALASLNAAASEPPRTAPPTPVGPSRRALEIQAQIRAMGRGGPDQGADPSTAPTTPSMARKDS